MPIINGELHEDWKRLLHHQFYQDIKGRVWLIIREKPWDGENEFHYAGVDINKCTWESFNSQGFIKGPNIVDDNGEWDDDDDSPYYDYEDLGLRLIDG